MPRIVLLLLSLIAWGGCQRRVETALDKLRPCTLEEGPTEAYCGQLAVFEDREAKQGRKIDLKIVVLPALRRDPKPDPIFILAGGPGEAAASMATAVAPGFRRFQTDRDVVLVDQRGTGKSNGLSCKPVEPEEENFEEINDFALERMRKCMEMLKGKANLALYTTTIAMDDLNEVRQFLGYERINLWGVSYGTRAALAYLKRHEATVRSAVLDSVAPPNMRLPLYTARDSQRALDRMFAACAADAHCNKEFPDLKRVTGQLLKRLEAKPRVKMAHPLTGKPIEFPLGSSVVAGVMFRTLYQRTQTSLLPRLLWDASKGNYQGLLATAMGAAGGSDEAMSEGMFNSVICAEDIPRISTADIARETKDGFYGDTMFQRMKACEFWPKGNVAADYYEPVHSARPVLLFSGDDDPITPPQWGEQVAKELKNARHFVVPGNGHAVSFTGCVPELIGQMLDLGSVSGLDGKCVQVQHRPPFFVNYTGPAAQAPSGGKP